MITLALDRYDRHFPFFDGTVSLPPGLSLKVLQMGQEATLRDGTHRHSRMLKNAEFDAAETSFSSYIVARSKGLPFTAIPVFPRRLFSQGQIFVNADSGIEKPEDLAGKKVGLQSFQTTLAVLAKGDIAGDHGVPLESIKWRLHHADTIATKNAGRFDMEVLPDGTNLANALAAGEIDALFFSRTPQPDKGQEGKIRRLFADPRQAERDYVARHGFWPIMHIIALKEDSVAANPDLPAQLMDAFADAQRVSESYLGDPNWSQIVWAKYALEEEHAAFDASLWTSGVAANRDNVERFIGYAADQGMIEKPLAVEDLFHPSVHGT